MAYIDPQRFKGKSFVKNEKSDIYALGVILWELSSGKTPFEHLDSYSLPFEIKNGQREKSVDGTPSEYVKLYTDCWDEDPEKRPTIEFVMETLNGITWRTTISQAPDASKTALTCSIDQTGEFLEKVTSKVKEIINIHGLNRLDDIR